MEEKIKINVHNSNEYSEKWDNKSVVEIANDLGSDVIFGKEYDRNILGYFYGTITAQTDKNIFYFPMTSRLAYGILPDADLENCIGKFFKWSNAKADLIRHERYNSGFFICAEQEQIIPLVPLAHPLANEFPKERKLELNEVTLSNAFERKMIKEIKIIDSHFIFSNSHKGAPFLIIDNCLVSLSYNASSMSICQFIRELDFLTFYHFKDKDSSNWYFRLGLRRIPEFSESHPLFKT